ncbi:MAG: hypothetical protein COU81_03200 [Candidatus Portnoybacteria bacterium CG10_big_fil_rev_8_21_14_0_10_36_7]|uniref:Uncharacterized protein n=1 Tax=Candidatus Portnoybacteria bacterium CG10_big_fil_rev_8_21_14_0_10_36_7 TaxID=1974812 RepID=A0A2M8KDN0_9BACT|nr:MAG: hypothetical protein COU81_03200 [Candidatus Portnoybacteria bacterium CG10_big_fil_rev_8_21_14_0_10_36_7]
MSILYENIKETKGLINTQAKSKAWYIVSMILAPVLMTLFMTIMVYIAVTISKQLKIQNSQFINTLEND